MNHDNDEPFGHNHGNFNSDYSFGERVPERQSRVGCSLRDPNGVVVSLSTQNEANCVGCKQTHQQKNYIILCCKSSFFTCFCEKIKKQLIKLDEK